MALLANLLAAPGRLAFGAGVVAVSVAGVAGLSSSALFTDTQTNSTDTVTTGNVAIDPDNATSTAINLTGMAPGDSAERELKVKNTGSLALRYAITSTPGSSGANGTNLKNALTAKVYANNCTDKVDGDIIFNGAFKLIAVGDPATGAQTGDRVLAAGTPETLCVVVKLDSSASNQGPTPVNSATATTSLTFTAEQTANN